MYQALVRVFGKNFFNAAARTAALPIAIVFGTAGYLIESAISRKHTPAHKTSIEQDRIERNLLELDNGDPLKVSSLSNPDFVPKSMLDRNLSPSLR